MELTSFFLGLRRSHREPVWARELPKAVGRPTLMEQHAAIYPPDWRKGPC
jgi:hypothetical protein